MNALLWITLAVAAFFAGAFVENRWGRIRGRRNLNDWIFVKPSPGEGMPRPGMTEATHRVRFTEPRLDDLLEEINLATHGASEEAAKLAVRKLVTEEPMRGESVDQLIVDDPVREAERCPLCSAFFIQGERDQHECLPEGPSLHEVLDDLMAKPLTTEIDLESLRAAATEDLDRQERILRTLKVTSGVEVC